MPICQFSFNHDDIDDLLSVMVRQAKLDYVEKMSEQSNFFAHNISQCDVLR